MGNSCCSESPASVSVEDLAVVSQQKVGPSADECAEVRTSLEALPALLASSPQQKGKHAEDDAASPTLPSTEPVASEAPPITGLPVNEGVAPPAETQSGHLSPDFELTAASDGEVDEKAAGLDEGPGLEEVSEAKPDFTGEWKMARCEGDWEAFMKDVGVSWALRKAAGASGYGVNKTVHAIKATGDRISIETRTFAGAYTREFEANGCEQDDEDPLAKKPIKIVPYWEEVAGRATLTLEGYTPATKAGGVVKKQPLTRRWLDGASMVVEQTAPNGVVVKSYFSKMAARAA